MPRIISIQSQVLHGHVGNAAAAPAMRALGALVTAVPTTLLSNHPHYETMRGGVLDAELVADLLRGIEERGLVADASVLVTGYLGSAAIGHVVADFVGRARAANPALRYICDPVLGDDDLGNFVAPGLLDLFRERLLPMAWLATPNLWEAAALLGSDSDAPALLHRLREAGAAQALITGGHAGDGDVRTLLLDGDQRWALTTPKLPARPAGTGDFFTGVLAAKLATGASLVDAAAFAVALTYQLLLLTPSQRWAEMPIETHLDDAIRTMRPITPEPLR